MMKTLARSISSVMTPTCARTSEMSWTPGPKTRAPGSPASTISAAASNRSAVCSMIDHRTSCFEATWAYRLAPWISTARAMSRTLVPS